MSAPSHRPARPRRRVALVAAAVALLAVLAGWHYTTLYGSATAAHATLRSLEGEVGAIGLEAERADLVRVERRLAEARAELATARAHLRWDPLLQAARLLPRAGEQVEAADGLLDVAAALVEVAEEGADLAHDALAAREADDEPLSTTVVRLLRGWGPRIERMQMLVDRAVERRLAVGDAPLIGPLEDARARVDGHLPRLVEALDQAEVAQGVLPDLLGFEGERRYLVLSLNNAELLPGGGLVTVAGVITVRDGRPVASDFRDTAAWNERWDEIDGPYLPPPDPLRRHVLKEESWNLGLSDWDPDFTVWAPHALELYERAWGEQEVHGVVAVDLDVLRALLEVTGPQTVDAPGFGEVRVTSANAFLELERVTRYPGHGEDRTKAAVGELQEELLGELLTLPASEWRDLAEVAHGLGEERHLQVLLFHTEAQELVRELGWDGRLHTPPGDFLHLSEASVRSTKLNEVFQPQASYRIEVTALGTARHELHLRYHNTVRQWARGRDPGLVRHLMYDGQYGGYLRVFVPPDATAFAAEVDGAYVGVEDHETAERYRWWGVFLPVPPGAEREVTLRWSVPLATLDPDGYELHLQKQPGTDGLCIDLTVHRNGRAARIEVDGGTRDRAARHCLTTDVTVRAVFE